MLRGLPLGLKIGQDFILTYNQVAHSGYFFVLERLMLEVEKYNGALFRSKKSKEGDADLFGSLTVKKSVSADENNGESVPAVTMKMEARENSVTSNVHYDVTVFNEATSYKGKLYVNSRKAEGSKQPDYTGYLNLKEDQDEASKLRISAWKTVSKGEKATEYISMSFSPPINNESK